jgi:hypothetical protein
MWQAGAGMSALLAASVPGIARAVTNNDGKSAADIENLADQVGVLENEKEIRRLYKTYESLLAKGDYEEISSLFTNDGEVVFGGDIFKRGKEGIDQLFCNQFRSGSTGKRINSKLEIPPDMGEHTDTVEIMQDRKTARARFAYSIQVGEPIIFNSSLVEMARLQGEGIAKWRESGTCDIFFTKSMKDNTWKIQRLEYLKVT